MRITSILFAILLIIFLSSTIIAQDLGVPDTIRFELDVDSVVGNDIKLVGKLFFFNDAQNLAGVGAGFGWNTPNMRMDSARVTPLAESAFGPNGALLKEESITITNRDRQFLFFAFDFHGNGLATNNTAQHVATYWFTYSSKVISSICIDTIKVGGVIHVEFTGLDLIAYFPVWRKNNCAIFVDNDSDGIIDIVDNCPGLFNPDQLDGDGDGLGNVCDNILSPCGDADGNGNVTSSDLDFLIHFYFMFGDPPVSIVVTDVNGDGVFNLSDIMYLAAYLNNNGPAPCAGSEPPPSFEPKKEPKGRSTGSTGY